MDKRLVEYLATLGVDEKAMKGWTIYTATRDGEDVGFVISQGPEIHILPMVEKKALSRRNIIEFMMPLLARFGYVTTRVPIAETEHRLRTALGFERTWDDENFSYWALTRLRFMRTQEGEPSCLSPS